MSRIPPPIFWLIGLGLILIGICLQWAPPFVYAGGVIMGFDVGRFYPVKPSVPPWVAAFLNRRTTVEAALRDAAKAGRHLSPEECRALANKLSMPDKP